jgi:hypothetical protein
MARRNRVKLIDPETWRLRRKIGKVKLDETIPGGMWLSCFIRVGRLVLVPGIKVSKQVTGALWRIEFQPGSARTGSVFLSDDLDLFMVAIDTRLVRITESDALVSQLFQLIELAMQDVREEVADLQDHLRESDLMTSDSQIGDLVREPLIVGTNRHVG